MDLILDNPDITVQLDEIVKIIETPDNTPKLINKIYSSHMKSQTYDELHDILTTDTDHIKLYYLGAFYLSPNTPYQDISKGRSYIKLAAENNIARAQYKMYCITTDPFVQMTWLKRAAYNRYPTAMYYLGKYYYDGVVLKMNKNKGICWLKESADNNCIDAMNKLGYIYSKDVGYKNYCLSFQYYKMSCDLDNIIGIRHVALCYLKGRGVKKDVENATKYIRLYTQISQDDSLEIHLIKKPFLWCF